MKKQLAFWKSDWFLGVLVTLAFLGVVSSDVIKSLERKAYDLGVRASSRVANDKIAVIAIDDESISNIGRWPWPREVHAKMIDMLSGAKAKVIGNTVFFSEPQIDPGLVYVNKITQLYSASNFKNSSDPQYQEESAKFAALLKEAEENLDYDRKLADSVGHANNVLLGMLFQLGDPSGNPDAPLPEFVIKNNLTDIKGDKDADLPIPAERVLAMPIDILGKNAIALGHLNSNPDVDGGIRTESLALRYYDQVYPSFSLMMAAKSLNLQPKDIHIELGHGITLGNLKIRTNPQLEMYTYYYKDKGDKPAFAVDSFFDVYTGKIPVEKYRDKIVLIGPTAAGLTAAQVTPISPSMPPVLMAAHSISSILNQDFFITPSWGKYAEYAVLLLVGLYLIFLLPRLKAAMGATITAILLIALVATSFALMATQLMWLQLMAGAVLLLVGHLLLTTKRFLVTEKGKTKADAESAESNRMLGLAFQGQGQLDMAYDKFRKCPLDDSLMDNLYNLALDFERKRQFNKAESVFKYMSDYNPKFRDLEQRQSRAKQMSETVMLGGAGGRTNASTMMLGGTVEKPMLGRYQVDKELGKGAMGVVYLGKDPKIGRVVAIKTMALAQEFDAEELEEVKSRFFREAETAGRLNHPHIVTIFDAGEEHDLAYIAMEFLKGKDLVPYVKAENLLPVAKTMSIVARVAEALAYAHSQNVVHRDVKPANIMYEVESDTVKVTDFGIARITDSSKTKTGMVLGTPSYMSPEQLAGKKIDGKSDLFSLGVTLYQLASGRLPFQGDSMAQLMFKIANEAPVDVLSFRSDLPPCLVSIINKALEKDPENRYQTGEEMAQAIRDCASGIGHRTVDIDL